MSASKKYNCHPALCENVRRLGWMLSGWFGYCLVHQADGLYSCSLVDCRETNECRTNYYCLSTPNTHRLLSMNSMTHKARLTCLSSGQSIDDVVLNENCIAVVVGVYCITYRLKIHLNSTNAVRHAVDKLSDTVCVIVY